MSSRGAPQHQEDTAHKVKSSLPGKLLKQPVVQGPKSTFPSETMSSKIKIDLAFRKQYSITVSRYTQIKALPGQGTNLELRWTISSKSYKDFKQLNDYWAQPKVECVFMFKLTHSL